MHWETSYVTGMRTQNEDHTRNGFGYADNKNRINNSLNKWAFIFLTQKSGVGGPGMIWWLNGDIVNPRSHSSAPLFLICGFFFLFCIHACCLMITKWLLPSQPLHPWKGRRKKLQRVKGAFQSESKSQTFKISFLGGFFINNRIGSGRCP